MARPDRSNIHLRESASRSFLGDEGNAQNLMAVACGAALSPTTRFAFHRGGNGSALCPPGRNHVSAGDAKNPVDDDDDENAMGAQADAPRIGRSRREQEGARGLRYLCADWLGLGQWPPSPASHSGWTQGTAPRRLAHEADDHAPDHDRCSWI